MVYRLTWDVGRTLEEFVYHSPEARDLRILLVFDQHPAWFIQPITHSLLLKYCQERELFTSIVPPGWLIQ